MNKSASEYRSNAQMLLSGNYGKPILVIIAIGLFSGIYSFLQRFIGGVHTEIVGGQIVQVIDNPGIYWILYIGMLVVSSAFVYSMMNMYIHITSQQHFEVDEVLFSGFKEGFGKNIITNILVSIYTFLWALLLIIPGIIKLYAYSMTFYIRVQEPLLSSDEAITRSKELTKGHKAGLFFLDLSYIGWYILVVLTIGILSFWVVPRHMTARTLFFDDIYGVVPTVKQPLEEPKSWVDSALN